MKNLNTDKVDLSKLLAEKASITKPYYSFDGVDDYINFDGVSEYLTSPETTFSSKHSSVSWWEEGDYDFHCYVEWKCKPLKTCVYINRELVGIYYRWNFLERISRVFRRLLGKPVYETQYFKKLLR